MSYYPYLDKQFIKSVFSQYQTTENNEWKQNINSQVLEKYLQIKNNHKNKQYYKQLSKYKIFPKQYGEINYYNSKYNLDRLKRIQNNGNRKYQKNAKSQPHLNLRTPIKSPFLMQIQSKKQQNKRNIRTYKQIGQNFSLKSLSETNLTPSVISKVTQVNKNVLRSNNLIESDLESSIDINNHYTPHKIQDKSLNNRRLSKQKNKNNLLIFTENKNQIKSTQNLFNFQKQQHSNNDNLSYGLIKQKSKQYSRKSKQNYNDQNKPLKTIQKNQIQQAMTQYYGEEFERIKQERDYLRKHFILHLQRKHPAQIPYKDVQKIQTNNLNGNIIIKKYEIPHYEKNIKQTVMQVPRKYKN